MDKDKITTKTTDGPPEPKSSNYPYISPTPGEFPLIAVDPTRESIVPSLQEFKWVKDCGFNAVSISAYSNVDLSFDFAAQTNLKIIIAQWKLEEENIKAMIEKYNNNPYFRALEMRDEPTYYNWHKFEGELPPEVDTYDELMDYTDLRPLYGEFHKIIDDKMVYFNLSVGLSEWFTGEHKKYEHYLEEFQQIMTPSVWCYDFYPLIGSNSNYSIRYKDFYNYLSIFSNISKNTNRPFWGYCLSVSIEIDGTFLFPSPIESVLRFEAFSAIAFGAQGIFYFFYAQRKNVIVYNDDGTIKSITKYYDAPINRNGDKTDTWYMVRKINVEIKRFSNIFLDATLVKCCHTGNANYQGTDDISFPFCGMTDLETEYAGVIVSHFQKNGKNYCMITSRDAFNTQKITLKFPSNLLPMFLGGYEAPSIGDTTKSIQFPESPYNEYTVNLGEGGYIFYSW